MLSYDYRLKSPRMYMLFHPKNPIKAIDCDLIVIWLTEQGHGQCNSCEDITQCDRRGAERKDPWKWDPPQTGKWQVAGGSNLCSNVPLPQRTWITNCQCQIYSCNGKMTGLIINFFEFVLNILTVVNGKQWIVVSLLLWEVKKGCHLQFWLIL